LHGALLGLIPLGRSVCKQRPERAVVFQSACLLPWLSARDNVRLAFNGRAARGKDAAARADHYLDLVGVGDVSDEWPSALSLGTQQCVSLARALSTEPRFLLLDEPFSQLDSLTRFEMQDTLLRVWEESPRVVVMVTHDVDEALYLADRLILMTDGPEATVGDILDVPFARPRVRHDVLAQPEYYAVRRRVIDFLARLGELDNTLIMLASDNGASAEGGEHGSFNENQFANRVEPTIEQNLAHLDDWGSVRGIVEAGRQRIGEIYSKDRQLSSFEAIVARL